MPPLRQNLTVVALVGALAGCTVVGGPTPPTVETLPAPASPDPVVHHFGGDVALGGQRLDVSLELRSTDPPQYEATLRIPEISLEARGEGRLTDETLSLDLLYGDDDCAGQVHVEALMDPEGRSGAGALSATDCTGGGSGTIRLARQIAAPTDRDPPPR
jgi:hypothetical protein